MRLCLGITLVFAASGIGLAQQPTCSVPVSVVAPDLSTMPREQADALASTWRRNVQAMKYRLPGGRWDERGELTDLVTTSIHATGALPSARVAGLILPNGGPLTLGGATLVPNLPQEAFVASDGNHPVRILSVRTDRGPRRVVFVAENGKRMTWAGRMIESAVISSILSKARAEDSFGLLTAGGPRLALSFGSSRDRLKAAAENLANPAPHTRGEGVLDAVLEASRWFQPPQPGDSIFLMTMHLEGKRDHKVNFSRVRAALIGHGIRVFGFQLGEELVQINDTTPSYGPYSTLEFELFGQYSAFNQTLILSEYTGGDTVLENTERNHYVASADRVQAMQAAAQMMYQRVIDCYFLELGPVNSASIFIGLSERALDELPWVAVYYPKELPACSNTATTAERIK